jgi:hypothetical protein
MIAPPRALTSPTSYWQASRAPRYSLLFALPLLVLYEALAAALSPERGGVRNGADVLLKGLIGAVAGPYAGIALGVLLIGGSLWLVARDVRTHRGGLRMAVFGGMALESIVLALIFGVVVGVITAQLLGALDILAAMPPAGASAAFERGAFEPLSAAPGSVALGWWTQLMVSLGAGLYEELLFRVVLVSALAWGGRAVFGWRPVAAAAVAVVVSALVFSAFHYVGLYGDRLELRSFAFRVVAGLFFSGLYVLRGFGITAWTHALYDVFLLAL